MCVGEVGTESLRVVTSLSFQADGKYNQSQVSGHFRTHLSPLSTRVEGCELGKWGPGHCEWSLLFLFPGEYEIQLFSGEC